MAQAHLTQRFLARICDRAKIDAATVIDAWRDVGTPLGLSGDETQAVVAALVADGLLQMVQADGPDVRLTVTGVRRCLDIQRGKVPSMSDDKAESAGEREVRVDRRRRRAHDPTEAITVNIPVALKRAVDDAVIAGGGRAVGGS